MEINEIKYEKFVKWKAEKKTPQMTLSESNFTKQMFELLEDYPSFKNKITEVGSKTDAFIDVQQYLKETK